MAQEAKAKCLLCGAEYQVCKFCPSTKAFTPWRQLCESQRHFQIYMVVKDLRAERLKAAEAKEQLEYLGVDLKEVKSFVPSVQETLLPIFETQKTNKRKKETVETIEVKETEVEDTTPNISE